MTKTTANRAKELRIYFLVEKIIEEVIKIGHSSLLEEHEEIRKEVIKEIKELGYKVKSIPNMDGALFFDIRL